MPRSMYSASPGQGSTSARPFAVVRAQAGEGRTCRSCGRCQHKTAAPALHRLLYCRLYAYHGKGILSAKVGNAERRSCIAGNHRRSRRERGNFFERVEHEAAHLFGGQFTVRHIEIVGEIQKIRAGTAHGAGMQQIESAYTAIEHAYRAPRSALIDTHILIYDGGTKIILKKFQKRPKTVYKLIFL